MSTFGGILKEIQNVSVDRFDGDNLNSSVYFLSHCHTDHMVGLDNLKFQDRLIKNRLLLYASPITKRILDQLFPRIRDYVKELALLVPNCVKVGDTNVSVTLVPSGHCPGSVMFLFEGDKNVLYTGDFRINPNDLRKMNAFFYKSKQQKPIHKIYLDTTFFLKMYNNFPTRDESLQEVCTIIQNWVSKGTDYIVKLDTSAKYGYEFLFMEIFKQFKMPIHVDQKAFEFYSLVPEMDHAVSTDGSRTQIHSNCGSTFKSICKHNFEPKNICVIKTSALRWRSEDLKSGITEVTDFGTHCVCYSTHASYQECVGLLTFFKPDEVEPSVLRKDKKSSEEIFGLLNEIVKKKDYFYESETKEKLFKIVPEEEEEIPKKRSCDEFLDGLLDSPPRKK